MVQRRSATGVSPNRLRVLEGGKGEVADALDQSDVELIDAFERRDPLACDELYDRLVGTVEGTLIRILGRRDGHYDDLVQSAFEQIVVTLSTRRFARACSLRAWAASVTSYVAFNELRRRTRERRVMDPWLESDQEVSERSSSHDAERSAAARQVLARIRFHLAEMSEDRARTVFLHDVMGHDLAEIAVLFGVSVSAAQSRLFRGRKELQARLSQDGFPVRPGESS